MDRDVDEPVEIAAYDVRWPAWFEEDARELRQALGSNLHSLEHFGSTAVPQLHAKPIIDILVAPARWPLEVADRNALEKLGYHYLGEAGVPGREYFRRRAPHATNLSVVQRSSRLWHDNIALRDYLIAHPEAARLYGEAKRASWNSGATMLIEYSRSKSDFVAKLVAAAQSWRTRCGAPV
jgi:GrpB-like predicted nucleotidyltransferase (UPF0157 family)